MPAIEAFWSYFGKWPSLFLSSLATGTVSFWGIGLLFALPALFHVSRWKIQANRNLDYSMLRRSMPLIAFNFFFGNVLVGPLMLAFLPESSFDFRNVPTTGQLALEIMVWMIVEEVMFFYLHRWLHINKTMYARVHKLHHRWTAPVSFVAIYCHPLEHILCNLTPLLMGPLICRSHILAIGTFLFAGTIHTLAVHSGYWFCDDNGMHDEHHAKFTVNYGVMGLMDYWYGSLQLPQGAVDNGLAQTANGKMHAQ